MTESKMTLGELIDALKACKQDAVVYFDFCGTAPTNFDSWRGNYAELAIGWKAGPPHPGPTVADVLSKARACDGATFEGYKGGEYTMGLQTPISVDNWGRYTECALVGVRDLWWRVILLTESTAD